VTLLSEARKFGVTLVLANQFLTQMPDERILQAIFGNVGTLISFRLGQADAEIMEREFAPAVNRFDLTNLPNWRAYISTLVAGQTVGAFSLETRPDERRFDEALAWRVRETSRKRYGRSRREVDEEIARSLQAPTAADERQ